jgi:hypothetical protein
MPVARMFTVLLDKHTTTGYEMSKEQSYAMTYDYDGITVRINEQALTNQISTLKFIMNV